MAKFKNDKGLTLIELLITIAVLAVVSAIALPVINNVVSASNSNAAVQTQSDVTDFITKYNAAGETLFVSSATTGTILSGYVDTDGDNVIDSNELFDTLTINAKFLASVAGTSDSVGGTYTNDGVAGVTIILETSPAGNSGGSNAVVYTPGTDFPAFSFYGVGGGSAFGTFTLDSTSNAALLANFAYGNTYTVHVVRGSLSTDFNVQTYSWLSYQAPSMAFQYSWDGSGATAGDVVPNFSYTVDSISVTGNTITFVVH